MLPVKNVLGLNYILVETLKKKSKSSHKVLVIAFEKMEFANAFRTRKQQRMHVSVKKGKSSRECNFCLLFAQALHNEESYTLNACSSNKNSANLPR